MGPCYLCIPSTSGKDPSY